MKRVVVILKRAFFAMAVLLIGQIKMGDNTFGGHFYNLVKGGCRIATDRFMHTQFAGQLVGANLVNEWVHNTDPRPIKEEAKEVTKEIPSVAGEKENSDITSSDREKIIKLLQ